MSAGCGAGGSVVRCSCGGGGVGVLWCLRRDCESAALSHLGCCLAVAGLHHSPRSSLISTIDVAYARARPLLVLFLGHFLHARWRE